MAKPTQLQKQIPKAIFSKDDITPAPDTLSDEQAKVWDTVLMSVAPDWITAESYPQLVSYCIHVTNRDKLNGMLAALDEEMVTVDPLDPLPLKQLDQILKMVDRETRAIAACARALRITNQSLRSVETKKTDAKQSNAPWKS